MFPPSSPLEGAPDHTCQVACQEARDTSREDSLGAAGGDFSKADASGLLCCCDLETGLYRIARATHVLHTLEVWQWEDGFMHSLVSKPALPILTAPEG